MESKKVIKICGVPYTITEHDDIFNADGNHFGMIDFTGARSGSIRASKSHPSGRPSAMRSCMGFLFTSAVRTCQKMRRLCRAWAMRSSSPSSR